MTFISNRFAFRLKTLKLLTFFAFSLFCSSSMLGQTNLEDTARLLNETVIQTIARSIADSFGASVVLVEEFIREAKAMELQEGIPAHAFIGIAILESAGFTSYLYQNAKNPFGMRATKIWRGQTFIMWHEGDDAAFRKYESPREAVRDFAAFLNSRKWFRDALECPVDDLECFLNAMSADPVKKEPGYATDPQWADKVRRVVKKYGLDALR